MEMSTGRRDHGIDEEEGWPLTVDGRCITRLGAMFSWQSRRPSP